MTRQPQYEIIASVKRNNSKTVIACRRCNGSGTVTLSDKLQPIFDAIKHQRGITPQQIIAIVHLQNLHVTAVNQRLNELMDLNLIERARIGKAFQYFITKRK